MLRENPSWWSIDDQGEMIREFLGCVRTDSTILTSGEGERNLFFWRDHYNVLRWFDTDVCPHAFSSICYHPGTICGSRRETGWAQIRRDMNEAYVFFNAATFNVIIIESKTIPSDLAALFAYVVGWSMSKTYGDISILQPLSFKFSDVCQDCLLHVIDEERVDASTRLQDQFFSFAIEEWDKVITADGWLAWRHGRDGRMLGLSSGGELKNLPSSSTFSFLKWEACTLSTIRQDVYLSELPYPERSGIGATAKSHTCLSDWPKVNAISEAVSSAMTGPMNETQLEEMGWDLLFGKDQDLVLEGGKLHDESILHLALSYKHEARDSALSMERWLPVVSQLKALMRLGKYSSISIWNDKRSGVLAKQYSWAERALEPYMQLYVLGVKVGRLSNERERFWLQIERKLATLNLGMWTLSAHGLMRITRKQAPKSFEKDNFVSYVLATCVDHEDGDLWREDREHLVQDVFLKGRSHLVDDIRPELHVFDVGEMDWSCAGRQDGRTIPQNASILMNDGLLAKVGVSDAVGNRQAKVFCYRGMGNLGGLIVKVKGVQGCFLAAAFVDNDELNLLYRGRSSFGWYRDFGHARTILQNYRLVPSRLPKYRVMWYATERYVEVKASLSVLMYKARTRGWIA